MNSKKSSETKRVLGSSVEWLRITNDPICNLFWAVVTSACVDAVACKKTIATGHTPKKHQLEGVEFLKDAEWNDDQRQLLTAILRTCNT